MSSFSTTVRPVAEVCWTLEVSAPTYHCWQQLYGGMKATEAKRFKELEHVNTRCQAIAGGC
jgi:putative transposase